MNKENPMTPVLPKAAIDNTNIRKPNETFGLARKNLSLIKSRPKNKNAKGTKNEVCPKKRTKAALRNNKVAPD
jgi:hypothetical protein